MTTPWGLDWRRVGRLAWWEGGELLRDTQVGVLLAVLVLAAWWLLLGVKPVDPAHALLGPLCLVPLGFLFLAGGRRGATHEAAFRRLVLTCPVRPVEWFLARFLGLHLLSGLYLLLVLPFLAAYAALAPSPLLVLGRAVLAYVGLTSAVIFLGFLLASRGGPRAPSLQAGAVLVLALSLTLPMGGEGDARTALARYLRFLVMDVSPAVQADFVAGATSNAAAPWPLALLALAVTAGSLGVLAYRHERVEETGAPTWDRVAGMAPFTAAALLAFFTEAAPLTYGVYWDRTAWAVHNAALLLAPLALVPLSFAVARRRRLKRSAAARR